MLRGVLALLTDPRELWCRLLPGVRPRLCVPLCWWRFAALALLASLALVSVLPFVSVLTLLGVLALLRAWDLLLERLEGDVFVLVDLVDLELPGLMTELGAIDDLGGTEELLGIADLVVFKEAGGVGALVGVEGPVAAGTWPGFEDLFGGEDLLDAKGLLVLEVMVDVQAL